MNQAIEKKKQEILDPNWLQFNYDKLPGDQNEGIIQGLNQAMTPVFGMGGRLVWLENTTIGQNCSEAILTELSRTLPVVPENSHLLLTTPKKLDKRIKSTKLMQKYAQIQEFSLIPPWKTEQILHQVKKIAQKLDVKLTPPALALLAESVGNQTRQLWRELEKLKLYQHQNPQPLSVAEVSALVTTTTHNSLQLATLIRQGNVSGSLNMIQDLIAQNEPALRITATLVGQFRTWTIIKLMVEKGERDEKAIASVAEISNPKRIYFLKKEIASLSSAQLLQTFPILLALEKGLKQGANPLAILETKAIELCQVFAR